MRAIRIYASASIPPSLSMLHLFGLWGRFALMGPAMATLRRLFRKDALARSLAASELATSYYTVVWETVAQISKLAASSHNAITTQKTPFSSHITATIMSVRAKDDLAGLGLQKK